MFRRIVAHFGLTALTPLTLLGLLLVPKPAAAQQQGQNLYQWSGGWGRDSSSSSNRGSYNSTPTYYDLRTSTTGRSVSEYRSFSPQQGEVNYSPVSTSGAGNGSARNQTVLITVSVPANATIWFDDARTALGGAVRQFVSPPLTPDQEYVYQIKARWTKDGKEVTRSRRVNVHAGDVTSVSFFFTSPVS
jgi:uncharacterized protein (TIGR03000 family)